MKDVIRSGLDLGQAVRQVREDGRLRAVDVARQSGRSRDVLHRLERGEDVTVASLLDILRAMGMTIRLERLGMPTLEEVRQRMDDLDGEDDAA